MADRPRRTAPHLSPIAERIHAGQRYAPATTSVAIVNASLNGNLGGGLFAIVAYRRIGRAELLDDFQNSTAALAKEVAPFATRRDR